jgi:hypothetical protein
VQQKTKGLELQLDPSFEPAAGLREDGTKHIAGVGQVVYGKEYVGRSELIGNRELRLDEVVKCQNSLPA